MSDLAVIVAMVTGCVLVAGALAWAAVGTVRSDRPTELISCSCGWQSDPFLPRDLDVVFCLARLHALTEGDHKLTFRCSTSASVDHDLPRDIPDAIATSKSHAATHRRWARR